MNPLRTSPQPSADPLAGLRDIHLPPPPSWWPPAIGWWLAALLLTGAIAGWFIARRRKLEREKPARLALEELARIKTPPAGVQAAEIRRFIEELSILLRRFCLVRFPEKQVADLYGNKWVDFLAAAAATNSEREFFRRELALLAKLYAPDRELKIGASEAGRLKTAVQRWLESQKKRPVSRKKKEAAKR